MALGDNNGVNRFGNPAAQPSRFGQPAPATGLTGGATSCFPLPAGPASQSTGRFGAPADASGISADQVSAAAAQSEKASAAAVAFTNRFPGVKFTGTPDMSKIASEVTIHPGATIDFPDAKVGSISIGNGVEIAGTAHISTPKDGAAFGAVSRRSVAIGGQASLGNAPVAGSANAASASGPKSLRIDDCTIEGQVNAWRDIVKTTVKQGGSIEGNGGRVHDVCVYGGGKIGGTATVEACEVKSGTTIEGAVIIGEHGVALGSNCYIGGTGTIDDSTMEDGSRKEGDSSMERSTLEAGAKLLRGSLIDSRLEAGAVKSGPRTIKDDTVPARTEDKG